VVEQLSNIGIISLEKVESWGYIDMEEEGLDHNFEDLDRWHYTKRPITRVDQRVVASLHSLVWPSLGNLHPGFSCPYYTTRHNPDKPFKALASSLMRFSRDLQGFRLQDDEKRICDSFFQGVPYLLDRHCRAAGEALMSDSGLVYPLSIEEALDEDAMVDRLRYTFVLMPKISRRFCERPHNVEGVEFSCTMSKAIAFCGKLGYLDSSPVVENLLVLDDEDRFRSFLRNDSLPLSHSFVYTVRTCSSMPEWLYNMVFPVAQPSVSSPYSVGYDSLSEEEDVLI